jgi:hypothetical protein
VSFALLMARDTERDARARLIATALQLDEPPKLQQITMLQVDALLWARALLDLRLRSLLDGGEALARSAAAFAALDDLIGAGLLKSDRDGEREVPP